MDPNSFDFLKALPQEHFTTHKGKSIQVRELIKSMHPDKSKETWQKDLTQKKKRKR